jgi:predicted nucleic acid-binding protein
VFGRRQAAEWLKKLWHDYAGRLSTQVRKSSMCLGSTPKITPATVIRASEISEVWKISFWDGMIIAAAEQDEAWELLSEDLNPGQLIAGVRIVNPFDSTGRRRH